jgi:hypothetical protein
MVRKRYEGGYIERDETKTRVIRAIIYGISLYSKKELALHRLKST